MSVKISGLPAGSSLNTNSLIEVSTYNSPSNYTSQKFTFTQLSAYFNSTSSAFVNNFRLTLTSGTPVTTTDVTYSAAQTLYCTPYNGNKISLYDGSLWATYTSAEFSIALGTLTNAVGYDVFCYANSGVPTLELLAWSTATARATNLAYQNGALVKSGDATRLYLGSLYNGGNKASTVTMTIASPCVVTFTGHGLTSNAPVVFTTTGALPTGITAGTTYYLASAGTATVDTFNISATPGGALITTTGSQSGVHTCTVPTYTEDSVANRFLFNYYNQAPRLMSRGDSTASWQYTSLTSRQSNNSILNQLNFFLGINQIVSAFYKSSCQNTNAGVEVTPSVGLDTATAGYDTNLATARVPTQVNLDINGSCIFNDYTGVGLHFISMIERSVATGTTTWAGILKAAITGTTLG